MTLENIPNGQCNSVVSNGQNKNHVHPRSENSRTGKSVGYALHSEALHWFPIRATYHRARTVYDKLVSINDGSFEPYLPMQYMVEYDEKQVISYIKKLNKEFKNLSYGYGAAIGYSMIVNGTKTIDDAYNEAILDMKTIKEELNNE